MSPATLFLLSLIILPLHTVSGADKQPVETLNPDEKKALQEFFKHVSHSSRFTWDDTQPACTWKGIICDSDNTTVLYIRLPATALVGKIPPNSLGKLPSLRVLSLRINGLSGKLPDDFSNLTTLTRLYLNNNSFSGQIPYIDANKLIKVDISVNKFNSSIPHPFTTCQSLIYVNNIYLCGPPTNNACNGSYVPSPYYIKPKKKCKDERVIIGISVASGLVLLILMLCVRRTMYIPTKRRRSLTVGYPVNKLVVLDDVNYGFHLEDLLTASAEVVGVGVYGTSYKQVVEVEGKKTTVVVKRLKDVVATMTETEFRRIMGGLGKVKNVNWVTLIGFYYSEYEKWVVYDYVPGGSLSARLHGNLFVLVYF